MKTKIAFANLTDAGLVRQHNEDRAIVCDPGEELGSKMGYLIALADGMGGHAAGEVAAALALRELVNRYYSFEGELEPDRILKAVIAEVNAEVYEAAQTRPDLNTMGTTLVCAVMKDNWLWIANVGDSRAYLIRGGIALRLTKDHSWVEEQGLTEEEAKRTPFRSAITRSIGTSPIVEVDVFSELLQPRDVVLLCSDGLTKHVPGTVIGKQVAHSHELRKACLSLVQAAKKEGGTDNITVVAARMMRVRKRPDRLAVARAFPNEMTQAQNVILHRRRVVLMTSSVVSVCVLFLLLWGFGVLEKLGLDRLFSPAGEVALPPTPATLAPALSDSTVKPPVVATQAASQPQEETAIERKESADSTVAKDSSGGSVRAREYYARVKMQAGANNAASQLNPSAPGAPVKEVKTFRAVKVSAPPLEKKGGVATDAKANSGARAPQKGMVSKKDSAEIKKPEPKPVPQDSIHLKQRTNAAEKDSANLNK